VTRPAPNIGSRIALTVIGVAAGAAALYLAFLAVFPYVFAESGSARYAREHRGEAALQLLAMVALLWVVFECLRRAYTPRALGIIALALVAFFALRSFAAGSKRPPNLQPIGGAWHAVKVPTPDEADTVYFNLYYERRGRFERIDDLVAEYRFVPPDCLLYRGLKVVGRPAYAMCGYRSPVKTDDTLTAQSDLLARARTRPTFRRDWSVVR
jgi:hypothetical protein